MDLGDYIRERRFEDTETVERAVEESIQGGVCGVKATYSRNGFLISAVVDPSVPYGEIHEHHPW